MFILYLLIGFISSIVLIGNVLATTAMIAGIRASYDMRDKDMTPERQFFYYGDLIYHMTPRLILMILFGGFYFLYILINKHKNKVG